MLHPLVPDRPGQDGKWIDHDRLFPLGAAESDSLFSDGYTAPISSTTLNSGIAFSGTIAGDVVNGTALNDVLIGLAGNDHLSGCGGSDVIYGGTGDDVLIAQGDHDYLDGGEGSDTYYVSAETEVHDSGGSADMLVLNGRLEDFVFSYDAAGDLVISSKYSSQAIIAYVINPSSVGRIESYLLSDGPSNASYIENIAGGGGSGVGMTMMSR